VQLNTSNIEGALRGIFDYNPQESQPQAPAKSLGRKERQRLLRSQRRAHVIGKEQLRLREAYAARVSTCITDHCAQSYRLLRKRR
jgi:hypothetical protein